MTPVAFPDSASYGRMADTVRRVGGERPPLGRRGRQHFPAVGLRAAVGKTVAAIAEDAVGQVQIHAGELGSETPDGSDPVDAYNRYGALDEDVWVELLDDGRGWRIIQAKCGSE